jgi:hypothetical protein
MRAKKMNIFLNYVLALISFTGLSSAIASDSLYFNYCRSYGGEGIRIQVGSAGAVGVGQRSLGVFFGIDKIFHQPETPSSTNFTIFKTPVNDPSTVAKTGSLVDFVLYGNLAIDKGPDESKRLGTISIYQNSSKQLNGVLRMYNGVVLNLSNCVLKEDSFSPEPWEP